MSIWLRIDGYPATEIAPHSPPTWETLADGGSGAASWTFALSVRSQHQGLRKGALVEILCGSVPVYKGTLSEPDRTTGECSAAGLSTEARQYLALDSLGNNTRTSQTAIAEAIAQGLRATNPSPVSGPVAGEDTGNPITLGQLLDEYAEQLGHRWGVDHFGRFYMRADPTTPTWLASPEAAAFGTTDEATAQRLAGSYDAGGGVRATAFAGAGIPQEVVDLTDRGALTETAAVAILDGMLVRSGGVSWTNGVTLTREQLTTMGGTPAFLPAVQGGQLLRSFGLSYATQAFALDVVIGKTRYTAGESTIYLEPVNTAPRTAIAVWAA